MWPLQTDFVMNNWKSMAAGVSACVGVILIRRLIAGNVCISRASMKGKTVIVTGASTGIGKATSLELAKRGARVIMACRDINKAEKARQHIRLQTIHGQLIVQKLDLASFQSIHDFASQICKEEVCIHVLINNAGVFQCPYTLTEDGLEMQMGVNHFGHFLLVHLLLDKLKASVPSRIVIVSSGLHKYGNIDFDNLDGMKNYDKKQAYYASKLANNLFARQLARRIYGSGVSVHCLRPGVVRTELGRHLAIYSFRVLLWPLAWLLLKSPYEGCQTVIHCAVSEELRGVSGRFYAECAEEPWSKPSLDDAVAEKLWDTSEEITGTN